MEVVNGRLQVSLSNFDRLLNDSTPTYHSIESLHLSVSQLHHLFVLLVNVVPGVDRALPLISNVLQSLENVLNMISDEPQQIGLPVVTFQSGGRGRPQIHISRSILEYLIGNQFTVIQTADLLNVSASTVRRYMNQYGITVRSSYSTLTDLELDNVVSGIQQQHPNNGYRLMRGHLATMGYRIQQHRVRESLQRIDPLGVVNRWFPGIQRRTYSVPGPNALWHIDGNHKLIRSVLKLTHERISFV